jgi:hypothetical protein
MQAQFTFRTYCGLRRGGFGRDAGPERPSQVQQAPPRCFALPVVSQVSSERVTNYAIIVSDLNQAGLLSRAEIRVAKISQGALWGHATPPSPRRREFAQVGGASR